MYSDTSRIYFCVLMQHDRVIAYASRQLNKHEDNYPTMIWSWLMSYLPFFIVFGCNISSSIKLTWDIL